MIESSETKKIYMAKYANPTQMFTDMLAGISVRKYLSESSIKCY